MASITFILLFFSGIYLNDIEEVCRNFFSPFKQDGLKKKFNTVIKSKPFGIMLCPKETLGKLVSRSFVQGSSLFFEMVVTLAFSVPVLIGSHAST